MNEDNVKDWAVFENPLEVIPRNDLMEHQHGNKCSCKPYMDEFVLVHNSFDMREDKETSSQPKPQAEALPSPPASLTKLA